MEWLSHEQQRACIERWRKERYLAGAQWATMWRCFAHRHKRGADILFETAISAFGRHLARLAEEANNRPVGGVQSTSRPLVGEELAEFLDMELLEDYFLLIGYAIENLCKGILLAELPELVHNESRLDNLVITHELKQLVFDCGVDTSSDENEFLDYLEQCVTWKSKYPVPKFRRDYPVHEELNNMQYSQGPASWKRAKSLADGLFNRLSVRLEAARK